MNCTETKHWLDAYCDGELEIPRSLEIEQHLPGCQACSQRREQVTFASKQIRAAAFPPPEDLQRRIRTALQPQRQEDEPMFRPVRSWLLWWLSSAAAAVLVVALILAQTGFWSGSDRMVLNEIVDSHIRSLIGNHQVDVASSDQHTVRPWFEGKVDFAPPVPDLSPRGFEIIGGRADYINGHAAATLVYRARKHYISLFIWPSGASKKAVGSISFDSKHAQRGYQVLRWKSGSMNYWAISEISLEELRDFAKAFASEAAGY